VLCFDTLLQVFILKVVRLAVSALLQPFTKWAPFEAPEGAPEGWEWAGKRRRIAADEGGASRFGRGQGRPWGRVARGYFGSKV
jgi:hypothetical protein